MVQTILKYVFLTKNKPKLIPKFHSYISKIMWTNIIPKGTKKQICYLCPGSNHCYNLTNIVHWIRTLADRVRVGDFATGPSELDNKDLHKAVFGKIPVGEQTLVVLNGTNIFLVGLYFYFLNFIWGIWTEVMASSFWNHVIQISIRQVYFQDIYSQLWIVKIFSENIYFL